MGPQFIVTFRGAEVGRYETSERAVAAAQSVIDTELGARPETIAPAPHEMPQIFWQPPPLHFPFDAAAYWRQQASKEAPQYPHAPIGNQQFQGAPPAPMDPVPRTGPATVYGGPPAPANRAAPGPPQYPPPGPTG